MVLLALCLPAVAAAQDRVWCVGEDTSGQCASNACTNGAPLASIQDAFDQVLLAAADGAEDQWVCLVDPGSRTEAASLMDGGGCCAAGCRSSAPSTTTRRASAARRATRVR